MAEICQDCATKDSVIISQLQTIENLKACLQRLTNGEAVAQGQQILTAATSAGLTQNADGNLEFPTVSLEELSAFTDVHPVQFVPNPVISVGSGSTVQVTTIEGPLEQMQQLLPKHLLQVKGSRGTVKSSADVLDDSETPELDQNQEENEITESYEDNTADQEEEEAQVDGEVAAPVENQEVFIRHGQDGQRHRGQHVLVLGSPHTRKIPLRCPLPECPHADYRAWDRDLLRKHFEKYHKLSHPSPIFNYLCPFDGCRYISYNEPSYALYTHVKNVHRAYLQQLEHSLANGIPIGERDLSEVQIDVLPSEIKRTQVPILGTISMEKVGLKCPLPVCQAGTALFKYSSMKKLVEHFEKLHSFTHPNPTFVYCCPIEGCNFNSEVGNFRVYKHMKADHSELFLAIPTLPNEENVQDGSAEGDVNGTVEPMVVLSESEFGTEIVHAVAELTSGQPNEGEEVTESQAMEQDAMEVAAEESAVDELNEQPRISGANPSDPEEEGTNIFIKGSANMIVEPLKCPVENCPKTEFIATSTVLMKRHFWKQHRYSHPDPKFHFLCPVEGCTFVTNGSVQLPKQQVTTNIWRHIKRSHPEYAFAETQSHTVNVVDDALAASGIGGESEMEAQTAAVPQKPEAQLRVTGVEDVLHPGTLVKPFQLQCLFPACTKPPFSGADKTQLLRHYAHYHNNVDRRQPIIVTCPIKDCAYECTWPPQPLYFHVDSAHSQPEDTSGILHPINASLSKEAAVGDHTPVQIVGRPYKSGSFWCPVPGCGFSDTVLLRMRNHVLADHSTTHPNPTFIFVCPIQGCSFAKQNNYQALCTHMQREHGMKKERTAIILPKSPVKRKAENDEDDGPPRKVSGGKRKARGSTEKSKGRKIRKSTAKKTANKGPRARADTRSSAKGPRASAAKETEAAQSSSGDPPTGAAITGLSDSGNTLWIIKKASVSTLRRGAPRRAKGS